MCIRDRAGGLLVDFLPRGETINAVMYCETMNKLRCTIQNKILPMLSRGIVLLHDNARPHDGQCTQDLITSFGWEKIDYPLYSPDLAPSDYHLFLHLNRHLGGQRYDDDNDVKTAV